MLPRTSYRDALAQWQAALDAAGTPKPLAPETIELQDAAGRIPAHTLRTRFPSPPYAAAAMDGFALSSRSVNGARAQQPVRLRIDVEAFALDTGGALPAGCDAVVPDESVERRDADVVCSAPASPGKHVRLAGEDVPPGVVVGWPGISLRPIDCAALLATGVAQVSVVRRPRVAVIPTGNELIRAGQQPAPGAAFDSNSTMIAGAAQQLGAQTQVRPIVRDELAALEFALRDAAAKSDVVILLGGSSRGERDRSFRAMQTVGVVVVHGVATRPAKPVNLGLIEAVPIINLPGYPVAAHVAFHLYGAPLIRRLAGIREATACTATLSETIEAAGDADEWHEVSLRQPQQAAARALPLDDEASGFYGTVQADALVHLPATVTKLSARTSVEIEKLRAGSSLRRPLFIGPYDPFIEELAATMGFRCRWSATHAKIMLASGECELAGATPTSSAALTSSLVNDDSGLVAQPLGVRTEGKVVSPAGRDRSTQPLSDKEIQRTPWAEVAAVAAGLKNETRCSAYVAHSFGLTLIEPQPREYVLLWQREFEQETQWSQRLRQALASLKSVAAGLGWERVEG